MGFKSEHISTSTLFYFHRHTGVFTECQGYIFLTLVWAHQSYLCVRYKTKKEPAGETSKGKKASVIPNNSKVSDEPVMDQMIKPPNPADLQPG